MDDKNNNFLEELLPWSETLPENIRKPQKTDEKIAWLQKQPDIFQGT